MKYAVINHQFSSDHGADLKDHALLLACRYSVVYVPIRTDA
mgnify:CR=1 FL=1